MFVAADGNYGAFERNGTAAISSIRLHGMEGLHSHVGGGTGLNIFANPTMVFKSLSRPLLSVNA